MAVLLTPPFLQFFDANGDPLAGGKLYTYASGTTSLKATYTDESGDTEASNPIILDSAGRATVWVSGSYKFRLYDSNDVFIEETDDVTSFTTTGEVGNSFEQTFSGNGSDTEFTLSEDLGTDEKLLYIWIDAGGTEGFDFQDSSAYTVNGTTLTFGSAPASGTNNIIVRAPFRDATAASASAAAADTSSTEASTYAELALTGVGSKYKYSTTTTEADPGAGYFRLNNANPDSATEMYISATTDASEDYSNIIPTWDDGTSAVSGTIKVTDRSDTTNFYVANVTGAITDNTTWFKIPITFVDRRGTGSNDLPTTVTFTAVGDKGDTGDQGPSGSIDNIASQTEAVIAADDIVVFADVSDSDNSKRDTVQGILDLVDLSLDDLNDVVITSGAQGDIYYHNGTNIVNLGAGTSGQLLQTNGSGANPSWVDAPTTIQAYATFNGTTATILEGSNVSSITRNGAGDYTVNLGVTMSSTNYCVQVSIKDTDTGSPDNTFANIRNSAFTTTSFRIAVGQTGSATANDSAFICVAVIGTLA